MGYGRSNSKVYISQNNDFRHWYQRAVERQNGVVVPRYQNVIFGAFVQLCTWMLDWKTCPFVLPAGLLCSPQSGDNSDEIRFFVVTYVHLV